MRYILIFFGLFLFQDLTGQELILKKGVVIDSLAVNDSIAETYALYLPRDFSTQSSWPVIFIFDPHGRGKRALQLFQNSAEEQGYIIAASNNISSNESLLNNVRTATRFMDKIFILFKIKDKEIYTAGLGEGARVASVLPTVYPIITGVLLVGDIWINADYVEKKRNFNLVAMAGYRDHRFSLVNETAMILGKAGVSSQVYNYDGGDEWPTADLINIAVGNFTLGAIQSGLRPGDMGLVNTFYNTEMDRVEKSLQLMNYYKSYTYLGDMAQKYSRYGKAQEIKEKMRSLGKERLYKNQLRQYELALEEEAFKREEYLYFFNEDVSSSNFENLGWWNQQLKELDKLKETRDPAKIEVAHRLAGMLKSLAFNTYKTLKEDNAAIDPLVFTAILQTIFDKENPVGYFNIISLTAQDGDYYTALLYLEDLLKTGYNDMESLYDIPGTLDLRLSPEYNDLIRKYLGNSKYYNN